MKYSILVYCRPELLTTQVQDMIKKGWKPLGGLAVTTIASIPHFCQAMTFKPTSPRSYKLKRR